MEMQALFMKRPGFHISEETAAIIGARITELNPDGYTSAEVMLNDARSPDSPTHSLFEWDDSLAGEQYRLGQARYYLRSIQVVFRGEKTRAFVAPRPVISGYVATSEALKSTDMIEALRKAAMAQLKSWDATYGQIDAFADATAKVRAAAAALEQSAVRA